MLDQKTINDIVDHAAVSDLARHSWNGRGKAPIGCVKGMAATFGLCLDKLIAGDTIALAMVRVVEGEHDVFDHYEDALRAAGLVTEGVSDADRLRVLFDILMGLVMRESSGGYDIGQDASAPENRTAEKAEAGWFQQSWDSRAASPEIARLFNQSKNEPPSNIDAICQEGVKPRPGAFTDYGDGPGREFQALCKARPSIAIQFAAIGVRTLYNQWGPLIHRAAELRPEADALFRQVQEIVGANAPVVAQKPAAGWVSILVGVVMAMFRRAPTKPPDVPVPAPQAAAATPWMPWAAKEVGFHETGQNRNIGRYTGPAKCGGEGDPWCAIFANAGFESVGIPGTRSAMARSFENHPNFVKLAGPAFGAVTTLWRGSPGSGLGHVFFYVGENDRGILALGGNQSDQVCRQYEPRNRVVGYWWPKSVPLPKTGKIIVNGAVDGDANEGRET